MHGVEAPFHNYWSYVFTAESDDEPSAGLELSRQQVLLECEITLGASLATPGVGSSQACKSEVAPRNHHTRRFDAVLHDLRARPPRWHVEFGVVNVVIIVGILILQELVSEAYTVVKALDSVRIVAWRATGLDAELVA